MEYTFVLREVLEKIVTVNANSREDAQAMVEDMYRQGDVVLDADDYSYTELIDAKTREVVSL